MEELKVKYFTDQIDGLCYVAGKSDWIDLHAAEEVTLKAGEFRLIPLGVAIALPEGYEAHVVPRSSTFKNYGLLQANSMGIVDHTYRGDNDQWFLPVYATDLHPGGAAGGPRPGGLRLHGEIGGAPWQRSYWPPPLPGGRSCCAASALRTLTSGCRRLRRPFPRG